jgi:hypothetical protein
MGYGKHLQTFNQYALTFAAYQTDTSHTCDMLKEKLAADPENEDLRKTKAVHLRQADMAYKMQQQNRENSGDQTHAIWGDMMSVGQMPTCPTGASFYLRKLKVCNEYFYSASRNQQSMFIWSQIQGKKGTNDVVSGLHKCLETVPDTCTHLISWFDGTSSQLKNTSTLLYLLHRTDSTSPLYQFERISLKYAPPGHTYMACDRAFGSVSKQMTRRAVIGDPKSILKVINDCKNTTAQWLDRNSISIGGATYLGHYYSPDRDFIRVDDEPLLMKARFFSFGFTQVEDQESRQTVLVQNCPNEIRIRLVFDNGSEWKSFRVQQKHPRRASTHDAVVAYPQPLHIKTRKESNTGPAKATKMASSKIQGFRYL